LVPQDPVQNCKKWCLAPQTAKGGTWYDAGASEYATMHAWHHRELLQLCMPGTMDFPVGVPGLDPDGNVESLKSGNGSDE
jgi:hypothetical protein